MQQQERSNEEEESPQKQTQGQPHHFSLGTMASTSNSTSCFVRSRKERSAHDEWQPSCCGVGQGLSRPNSTTDATNATSNFFTASHMMETINKTMKAVAGEMGDTQGLASGDGTSNGVELFRRLPDGSAVPVDEADMKVTDSKMKMKQAAERVALLEPEEKLVWAKEQRLEGNRLFNEQKFAEAMDIYLTCLVASDYKSDECGEPERPEDETRAEDGIRIQSNRNGSDAGIKFVATNDDNDDVRRRRENAEKEVQLPVLLNLAACAMKLERYRKVEEFCNIALNELPLTKCGQSNVKVWYRRGKARMHLGLYNHAKHDLQRAFELAQTPVERRMIDKDMQKLESLVRAEEIDEKKYKMALRGFFQSAGPKKACLTSVDNPPKVSCPTNDREQSKTEKVSLSGGLYAELENNGDAVPKYSTLRATSKIKKNNQQYDVAAGSKVIDVLAKMDPLGLAKLVISFLGAVCWQFWSYWNVKPQGSNDTVHIERRGR